MTKGEKMADKIYVSIDGKTIEATGQVLEELLKVQAEAAQELEAKNLVKKTKADAKTVLLGKLGISEDEAKLLLL